MIGRTWSYRLQDRSADTVRNLVEDPSIEDTSGLDRGTYEVLTSEPIWSRLNRVLPLELALSPDFGVAVIYGVCLALPALALLFLWTARSRMTQVEAGQISSLAVLCLLLGAFILRPLIEARIGGAAPPMAVLGAWIVTRLVRRPVGDPACTTPNGGLGVSAGWKSRARHVFRLMVVLMALVAVGTSAMTFTAWDRKFRKAADLISGPSPFVSTLDDLKASPPGPLKASSLRGLADYVRRCTQPKDRVLTVAAFMPEFHFLSKRDFAGGMLVSGHWEQPRFAERIVRWLHQHPPAIVVVNPPRYDDFRARYPTLEDYLLTNYRSVGESSFASSDDPPF